jgi:hypothetical protein
MKGGAYSTGIASAVASVPYLEHREVAVKLVAEYLEQAFKFSRMAAEATDPKLKESLEKQAAAYRKLGTSAPQNSISRQ